MYAEALWSRSVETRLILNAESDLVWLFQVGFSEGVIVLFYDWLSNGVDV